jgi:hypothetical protein
MGTDSQSMPTTTPGELLLPIVFGSCRRGECDARPLPEACLCLYSTRYGRHVKHTSYTGPEFVATTADLQKMR